MPSISLTKLSPLSTEFDSALFSRFFQLAATEAFDSKLNFKRIVFLGSFLLGLDVSGRTKLSSKTFGNWASEAQTLFAERCTNKSGSSSFFSAILENLEKGGYHTRWWVRIHRSRCRWAARFIVTNQNRSWHSFASELKGKSQWRSTGFVESKILSNLTKKI